MTTPFEDQMNADLALIMDDTLGPAMDMVLVDAEGKETPLRGILSLAGLEVPSGIGGISPAAPVTGTTPLLHIPLQTLQTALGRPLSTRDSFIIRGTSYKPQRPLDNGYGVVTIKLLKKE